ncbi:MAG: MFS transporter [Gemmatimonadales bacterium]|nr:MFS transporter [Gemmatimonadales bacterium]
MLIATCFVDMVGFAMVLPLLPFYALKLSATPEIVGALVSAFSVAQLVSAPLWGRLSDRRGRRPALMIGLAAAAVAYVVFGLADSLWLLFLSRLIQGAGGGTTGVAQAYIADTIAPENRAKALGWLSAATSAGVMVGPALGSWATRFGPSWPGFTAALLCVVNLAFAWRYLPESRRPGTGDGAKKPVWAAAWRIVTHPGEPTARFIWIYAVGMLAFTALTSILGLFLKEEYQFTEQSIGSVYAYIGGLSLVVRSLFLGPVVKALGEVRAMRLGTVALIIGLVLYPHAGPLWVLLCVMPLVPVGTALLFPATTSLTSRSAPKGEVGTIMGVAQTFAGIARILAPLMATFAFQRFSHAMPFYLAGGIVALVGILALKVDAPAPPAARPA